MNIEITFQINTENLPSYDDQHLVSLWHIAQANPTPIDNREAGEFTEHVGREIIRRFLAHVEPPLWEHQGRHYA